MGVELEKESDLFCHKVNIDAETDPEFVSLTNFKEGKDILNSSNLKILSASDLNDAAKKIVEAVK